MRTGRGGGEAVVGGGGLVTTWSRGGWRGQAKDELMMHEDAVLALAWSKDSEMLATADQVRREAGPCQRYSKGCSAALPSCP